MGNDSKFTPSELIRAKFMTLTPTENERMEVAKEWELMENSLHKDGDWELFNMKDSFSATRMDLPFARICPRQG